MSNKKIISTPKAPSAIGPYAQANHIGNLVFTSGQIPLDPKTMKIVEGGITEQTEQVLQNVFAVLHKAKAAASTIVKTTCYLKNLDDIDAFNEVYRIYFPDYEPARSCVEVSRLPMDVLVEIEAIAVTALKEDE